MKRLILSAALATLPMITHAAPVTTQDACEKMDSDDFLQLRTSDVRVIEVGPITKAAGVNQCQVEADTTLGRIKIIFTTIPSINGGTNIKNVKVTQVSE
jgi:hypothetical protein